MSRIIALAVINGLAVIVLGMSRLSWPTADFWTDPWVLSALVITGLIPVVQVVLAERGEKARRKAVEREVSIQAFLGASLVYLVRHCGADWEKTGVQAFVVKKHWFRQRQVRLAKVRLTPMPTSGVAWVKGKGVIGRCWDRRAGFLVNVEGHFSRYANYGEAAWNALSDDDRFGLTYQDFQHLRGKYGWIGAEPMIGRKDKYIGCITMDMPPGHNPDGAAALDSLRTTAMLVAMFLES